MITPVRKLQPIDELTILRQKVAQLEILADELHMAKAQLAWLATFPEQNPNPVIETDQTGQVTYLNPVAQAQFPELWKEGFSHPILSGLKAIIATFESASQSYVAREIDLEHAVYEQKICYARQHEKVRVRVYVHDITRRKRAEEAIQKLARGLVFAEEESRKRISRELHDEAGQALTALKLSLELIGRELPVKATALRQNFAEAIALTESTKEQIRLLARGLRPPALDTLGLNRTLEAFCRDFAKQSRLAVRYKGTEVPGLLDATDICLYRTLQEALTNVVKHAQATKVEVKLAVANHAVRLLVADNGRGRTQELDKPRDEELSGIGLLGMRERLELLGGRLEVVSEPGHGLRLVAQLPITGTA